MAGKIRLGKGLDALIPPSDSALKLSDVQQMAVEQIRRNPHQPRTTFPKEQLEELAASIRAHGVIQPLIVKRGPGEQYTLIAGERRLHAARLAGLAEVPVVLREADDQALVALAQKRALGSVLSRELNVRQTEDLVRRLKGHKAKKASKPGLPADIQALQAELRDALGTKVNLKHSAKGGSLTLYFYSDEELDSLAARLLKRR